MPSGIVADDGPYLASYLCVREQRGSVVGSALLFASSRFT